MMHPSNQNMMLICWFVDYDGSCDPQKMHRPNLSKNFDGSLELQFCCPERCSARLDLIRLKNQHSNAWWADAINFTQEATTLESIWSITITTARTKVYSEHGSDADASSMG